MSRRIYIHPSPELHGHRKAIVIGVAALVALFAVGMQLRLTFSEAAIDKARNEISIFSQSVAEGAAQVKPSDETVADVKESIVDTAASMKAGIETQQALTDAAASAAASVNSGQPPASDESTTDTTAQPEPVTETQTPPTN